MKFYYLILLLIASVLLISSAIDSNLVIKNIEDPLVKKKLQEKLQNYRDEAKEKCLNNILDEAEKYVDSMIIDEINIELMNTTEGFPEKPLRPTDYPNKIELIRGERDSIKKEE